MSTVPDGKITVSPEVLLEIIEQAALYTEGVVGMASVPPRVDRLFRRLVMAEGIQLEIHDDSVTVDVYLIVRAVDLMALSQRVQKEVIRAMDKLVGLQVRAVNVHIEDVEYPNNGNGSA
jgi:uncharacterized alkaline shock family protein YloU